MAESRARSTDPVAGVGSAYEVVPLRPSWGSLALLLFFCAIFSRPLFQFLPWRPGDPVTWWLMRAFTPILISILGLASGLVGLRWSSNKTTARAGVFLNGTVIALAILLIAVFLVTRYWR